MLSKVVRLEELDEGVFDGFTCGDDWMDNWLANKASRQLKSGLCAMHVGLDEEGSPVGFFTLAACQLMPTDVLKRERHGYNRMPFGALLIGELAVRSDLRGGLGYGAQLLNHAIYVACNISHDVGVSFLVVDPLGGNEHICRWYQHNGCVPSPQGSRHYMSMRKAKEHIDALGEDYFLLG